MNHTPEVVLPSGKGNCTIYYACALVSLGLESAPGQAGEWWQVTCQASPLEKHAPVIGGESSRETCWCNS